MTKKLFKFIIVSTILVATVLLVLLHFYYYNLHFISEDFEIATTNTSRNLYSFTFTNSKIKMTSFKESEAILSVEFLNSGSSGTATYSDVSVIFVNVKNDSPKMIGVDTDSTKWNSGDVVNLEIPINMRELGFGQYNVYLRVWDDKNSQMIEFTNNYADEKYGYYIGSLSVSHLIF